MIKLEPLAIRDVTRVVFDDGGFSRLIVVGLACGHRIPVMVEPYLLRFNVMLVSPCLDCRVIEP